MTASPRRLSPGFSLVEILVALAVFVLASAGILALFSRATQDHIQANDLKIATLLASSVLAKCEAYLDQSAQPLSVNDVPVPAFPGYVYDLSWEEILPCLDDDGAVNLNVAGANEKVKATQDQVEALAAQWASLFKVTVRVRHQEVLPVADEDRRETVFVAYLSRNWRDVKPMKTPAR